MDFISPSQGQLTFDETYQGITSYVDEQPHEQYRLIIGTDSQTHASQDVCFVTAIIIHRVGKGARYFYRRLNKAYMNNLRQRIYYETYLSLEVAMLVTAKLAENGDSRLNVEIHLDVGEQGATKELIREVVGMVSGSGFPAFIKPDSYGASKVADKYTK
ncbi:MAG TPA: ribonuclease H-like YkuK family protein [Oscillospiraceae bacterium]|nr:ribonuclease H-like YkuK family protein [Oscillospiraceae bacterium]